MNYFAIDQPRSQIFGFLHPKDLLSLSRTTRDFRALLMNRNAARFWEEARKQVEGLPNKPPLMSEPAFANLLFCNHCHVGGSLDSNCSVLSISSIDRTV